MEHGTQLLWKCYSEVDTVETRHGEVGWPSCDKNRQRIKDNSMEIS